MPRRNGRSGRKIKNDFRVLLAEGPLGLSRAESLRGDNAREILRLLRLHNPCSRADLVRHSGLSAPTVSSAIAHLQRRGLVRTLGFGSSNGGRPPTLLRFEEMFGYVIGVDIGGSTLRIALADLNGNIVGKKISALGDKRTPKRLASLISSSIGDILRRNRIPSKKLLALGVGAPGITDVQSGIVVSAPNLSGWDSVPLREILELEVHVPVAIENDVNLGALGESWRGTAQGEKNFVFLAIGTGVGAGIFVNGALYHGSGWAAGEIGYLQVPGTDTAPVSVHSLGSLESVIAGKGIESAWTKLRQRNHKRSGPAACRIHATGIFDRAQSGERAARQVLDKSARILANAVTNISLILNSSLVVFGGRIGTHSALFEATRRIIERNEFARPRLAISLLGPDAQLYGAIRLAIKTAEAAALA